MPSSNTPWKLGGALGAVALVAAGAWLLTDDDSPTGGPGGSGEPTPQSAPLEVSVAKAAGKLDDAAQAALVDEVTPALQEYVDHAFLGDYPRTDFSTAFSAFTKGAAAEAEADRPMITAASYAESDSVTAESLTAKLAVFAPGGKPAGVTAKVRFVLEADGTPAVYAGRLLLTHDEGSWRIFGYDMKHNDQATGATQ